MQLLLGILVQDDDEAAEVLSRLGMNMQVLRGKSLSFLGAALQSVQTSSPPFL